MNNQMLEDENIQAKVDFFVSSVQEYATYSQGKNVMYMMGCDYAYENAFEWYNNVDRLISAVNAAKNFCKIFNGNIYSRRSRKFNMETTTISYHAHKIDEESVLWGHMYWSGYFTLGRR